MARAHILEFAGMAENAAGHAVPVAVNKIVEQTIDFTTNTQSAVFRENTRYIRVIADAAAHFVIGKGVLTATAQNSYLAADAAEYFGVNGGDRIAFYDGVAV